MLELDQYITISANVVKLSYTSLDDYVDDAPAFQIVILRVKLQLKEWLVHGR